MTNFSHGVSEDRVISQFSDFIHSSQFRPKSRLTINADGNIHRYTLATESNSGKSGAYALHLDGTPAGFVMDWHDSKSKITWKYEYTDEERREFGRSQHNAESRAKYESERRDAEHRKAEEKKLHIEKQQAALSMAINEYLYADLFGAFSHPYLRSRFIDKGIHIEKSTAFNSFDVKTSHEPDNYRPVQRMPLAISRGRVNGGLCKPGEMLISMLNVLTGAFQSLLHVPVKPDKDKGFMKYIYKNTSITGAAHWLIPERSENADTVFACEGFSTGLACIVLTGCKSPVFSAGSCGNLYHVCKGLRKRYAGKRICVMADNDKATEAKTGHNPGIETAENCVKAGVADYYKAPPVNRAVNYDWYDFLKEVMQNKKEG